MREKIVLALLHVVSPAEFHHVVQAIESDVLEVIPRLLNRLEIWSLHFHSWKSGNDEIERKNTVRGDVDVTEVFVCLHSPACIATESADAFPFSFIDWTVARLLRTVR